jgi:hypothetical protein
MPAPKGVAGGVASNSKTNARGARTHPRHTNKRQYYRRGNLGTAEHHVINHQAGERWAHTKTREEYFSVVRRRMKGIYQHVQKSICTTILPSLISGTIRELQLV